MKDMKKIVICCIAIPAFLSAMEQPKIVTFEQYILQDENGEAVTFPGDLVRELVPGLAEKFVEGWKEGRTGIITIHNLNQAGLQVLKRLLNKVNEIQKQFVKHAHNIDLNTYNAVESIVFPEQEKHRENTERGKILQDSQMQKNKIFMEYAQQAASALEKTPSIGDYFLDIFNNLMLWRASPFLSKATGIFAAEHIDFGNDEEFVQLKQLDPRAQLVYLLEAHYTSENIYRAYEWFKELINSPVVKMEQENGQLLNFVSNQLVIFTAAHIKEIVAKHPGFKVFILDPILAPTATQLCYELMQLPEIAFENVLMNYYSQDDVPRLVNLGNGCLGIIYGSQFHILDINTHKLIKKIPLSVLLAKAKKPDEFKFIGGLNPNHIIAYRFNQLILFDWLENKMILNYTFQQKSSISSVVQLDENEFLVLFNLTTLKMLDTKNHKETVLINGIKDIVMFDPEHLVMYRLFDQVEILFWNSVTKKSINKVVPEIRNREGLKLHKINSRECIATEIGVSRGAILSIYLVDGFADTIAKTCEFPWEHSNHIIYPLNATNLLFKHMDRAISEIKLLSLSSKKITPFIDSFTRDIEVLNQNHIAAVLKNPYQVIIKFVPQTSTLSEILDEVQRHVVPVQPGQKPVQSQKRPASPAREIEVPAAAQGLRPASRETKQPRLEKPNG